MDSAVSHAMDRRSFDEAGRMHVPDCRISKANVCGYYGREIPNWQQHRLNPNQIYQLYRDPAELQHAADTFNNVPLTLNHIICTADEFPADRVHGTVSNARFEAPYLVADIAVWTGDAITLIAADVMRELSCGYLYDPVMIPGTTPDGVRYDGRMTNLRANHVAVVEKGRAGPDVMVADTATGVTRMKRPKIIAALAALLGAVAKPEQLAAMDEALDEEMRVAKPDEVKHCLSEDEKKTALDECRKTMGKDTLSPEEEEGALSAALAKKNAADNLGSAVSPGAGVMYKPGMDQATFDTAIAQARAAGVAEGKKLLATDTAALDAAVATAVSAATKDMIAKTAADALVTDAAATATKAVHAMYAARDAVAPKVGLVVMDSMPDAAAVYRFAMDKLGTAHKDVPDAALPALWASVAKIPVLDAAPKPAVTADSLFSGLSSIRKG